MFIRGCITSRFNKKKQRTSFNIGRVIDLSAFNLEEAKQLLDGLINTVENPEAILKEVLFWTGGQPFLTQKLCTLVIDNIENKQVNVGKIVDKFIIHDWQQNDSPLHFKTISDRAVPAKGRSPNLRSKRFNTSFKIISAFN